MKILVTFAVASEFAAWRRHHDFRQVSHEPFALYMLPKSVATPCARC